MRKYRICNKSELEIAVCNCCGKQMKVENGILMEGFCQIDIKWGYFSQKDGMRHEFDLCETCYDRICAGFSVPVREMEETEYM